MTPSAVARYPKPNTNQPGPLPPSSSTTIASGHSCESAITPDDTSCTLSHYTMTYVKRQQTAVHKPYRDLCGASDDVVHPETETSSTFIHKRQLGALETCPSCHHSLDVLPLQDIHVVVGRYRTLKAIRKANLTG